MVTIISAESTASILQLD